MISWICIVFVLYLSAEFVLYLYCIYQLNLYRDSYNNINSGLTFSVQYFNLV